jgi:centrosomal protein CEP164
VVPN